MRDKNCGETADVVTTAGLAKGIIKLSDSEADILAWGSFILRIAQCASCPSQTCNVVINLILCICLPLSTLNFTANSDGFWDDKENWPKPYSRVSFKS